MAISVNWVTGVISIPRADMTLLQSVPTEIRQLNIMEFKDELGGLKDDVDGRPWTKPFTHNTDEEVEGVILSHVFKIIDPYTVTFEDGQYGVNLTGANSNIRSKTNRNQVSIASSNSAGLQDLSTLLSAAYNGRVVVDAINGQDGTSIPLGTLSTPVKGATDGIIISNREGIDTLYFKGDYTLTENVAGFILKGQNAILSSITINPSSDTQNCAIEEATITGTLDGGTVIRRSVINGINYINGVVYLTSLLATPIVLGGSAVATFIDCFTGEEGDTPAVIDMGGAGQSLILVGYTGDIKIINHTGTDPISIDMKSGRVIIDSTCTNGDIFIGGICEIEDYSTGSCNVDWSGAVSLVGDILNEEAIHDALDDYPNKDNYKLSPSEVWEYVI